MKDSTARLVLWIGSLWVIGDVIWAVVFLAGNPHYFGSGGGLEKLSLYGNIVGFLILGIPGAILILIARRKLKQ